MFEWSEELKMVRDAVRTFVDTEIRPHREELEHGDLPPYDLLRKLYKTFGMDQMAADSFDKRIAAEEAAADGDGAAATSRERAKRRRRRLHAAADHRALQVLAGHGHRDGRVGRAHRRRDHVEGHDRAEEALGPRPADDGQDRRVGDHRARLGLRRVRADGVDRAPRRRRVRAQRLEDVHHQRPVRRHDRVHLQARRGQRARPSARSCSSCSTAGMPGLEQSKPLRKMGLHSSPTGMLFLDDVRVGRDRLLGESEEAFGGGKGREASKATFVMERSGVAAMALGIIERCLELSVKYAKERVQFGKPIGEFQLIQLKLAKMEVARLNVENLVFRVLESSAGRQADDPVGGVGDEALLRAARRPRSRSRRCSSSAATATWPSTRSSSSPATPRCCRSTPAPTRSRSARSPGRCLRSARDAGRAAAVALGAARSGAAATTRSSRSAATSSRARCSTRTGAACSRCASRACSRGGRPIRGA